MPAKNVYHDLVVRALIADGWTITHDPLTLKYKKRRLYIDLGAERGPIAAEREGRKIAIEVQSFLSSSPVSDLERAIGQYSIYKVLLRKNEPERVLYMAVTGELYETLLKEQFDELVIDELQLKIVVIDDVHGQVMKWIG